MARDLPPNVPLTRALCWVFIIPETIPWFPLGLCLMLATVASLNDQYIYPWWPARSKRTAQFIFLALTTFSFFSRCLRLCHSERFNITLLAAEAIGNVIYAAFNAFVVGGEPLYSVCLLSITFCSVLRYSLASLASSHAWSRWIYKSWPPDGYFALGNLSARWQDTRTRMFFHDQYDRHHVASYGTMQVVRSDSAVRLHELEAPWSGFGQCHGCYHKTRLVTHKHLHNAKQGPFKESGLYRRWTRQRNKLLQQRFYRVGSRAYIPDSHSIMQLASQHTLCDTCELICSALDRYPLPRVIARERDSVTRNSGYESSNIQEQLSGVRYLTRHHVIYEHVGSPEELRLSAASGCHLCAILWFSITASDQDQLLAGDKIFAERATNDQRYLTRLWTAMEQRDAALFHRYERCIRIGINIDSVVPHYGPYLPKRWSTEAQNNTWNVNQGRNQRMRQMQKLDLPRLVEASDYEEMATLEPVSRNTGDNFTVGLIKQLFGLNGTSAHATWLPARLLDVSAVQSTGKVSVRSRDELSQTAVSCSYVALSHCWGQKAFLKYSSATRARFESGINVSDLTKTFQEAIDLTSRLGISFIWIDSLCILQGVEADWHKEAHAMGKIYKAATLTIAAVASLDGAGGLFRAIEPLSMTRCLLTNASGSPIYISPMSTEKRELIKRQDVFGSQWSNRGWTLQEQMLSPRVVYFGEHGLYFERKHLSLGTFSSNIFSQLELDAWNEVKEGPRNRGLSWYEQWWEWITSFTDRQLTDDNDRGVAVLGLAEHLAKNGQYSDTKINYVSGLWRERIGSGLLWYVEAGHAAQRPDIQRGPTWSWISVDGRVFNDSIEMSQLEAQLQLVDILSTSNADMPEQDLRDETHLILRAKVRTCLWDRHCSTPYYYASRTQLVEANKAASREPAILEGVPIASTQEVGPPCHPLVRTAFSSKPFGWFVLDTSDLSSIPDQLDLLCINVEPELQSGKDDFTRVWAIRGLVLQRVRPAIVIGLQSEIPSTAFIPSFKRIGYFELESAEKGVCFPFETAPLNLTTKRVPPDTDPTGFFAECNAQLLRLC